MIGDGSSEQGLPAPTESSDPISQAVKNATRAVEEKIIANKQPETDQLEEQARKEAETKKLADLNRKLVELTGREDVKALLKSLKEVTKSDRLTLLNRFFSVDGKPLPMLQIDSKGSIYVLNAPGDLQNDAPLTEFKRVNILETPTDERGTPYLRDSMKEEHPFLADTTSFYGKRNSSPNYEAATWVLAWDNPHYRDLTPESFDGIVQKSIETVTQEISNTATSTPIPEIPK